MRRDLNIRSSRRALSQCYSGKLTFEAPASVLLPPTLLTFTGVDDEPSSLSASPFAASNQSSTSLFLRPVKVADSETVRETFRPKEKNGVVHL